MKESLETSLETSTANHIFLLMKSKGSFILIKSNYLKYFILFLPPLLPSQRLRLARSKCQSNIIYLKINQQNTNATVDWCQVEWKREHNSAHLGQLGMPRWANLWPSQPIVRRHRPEQPARQWEEHHISDCLSFFGLCHDYRSGICCAGLVCQLPIICNFFSFCHKHKLSQKWSFPNIAPSLKFSH